MWVELKRIVKEVKCIGCGGELAYSGGGGDTHYVKCKDCGSYIKYVQFGMRVQLYVEEKVGFVKKTT